jgi:hypothetical protein
MRFSVCRVSFSVRRVIGVVATIAIMCGVGIPAWAQSGDNSDHGVIPVVGAFSVGANISGEIDERTGSFRMNIPLLQLAGSRRWGC